MRSWSVGRGRAGAPSPRSRFCRTCAGHRRWQLAGSAGCRQGRPWRSAGPTHKGPELSYIFACFFIFSADHDESSPEPADLAKQAGLAKSVNGVAPEVGSGSNRDDEAQEEPQDTRYIDSEADVAAAWEDVRGVEWWDRRIGVLSPRKLRN